MDATDRIVEVFNRLCAIGQPRIPQQPYAEQVVYFIVAARCEIDMEGSDSVYEQAFTPAELKILIDGLRLIREEELADEFAHGFELLLREGFYEDLNWNKVSASLQNWTFEMRERIGQRLWSLDEKLVVLLDNPRSNSN